MTVPSSIDNNIVTTAAASLAKILLVGESASGLSSQVSQLAHRQELIKAWGGIAPGSKVVELGCGQGDCTVAIADLVGENGRVDAIDPAPPGYGAPYTVQQAQAHISTSLLGSRINWINGKPLEVLKEDPSKGPIEYDIGILAHCVWYFSSPETVIATLRRLGETCKKVYVAEWSLSSPLPEAQPHIFSALTQASLECRKPSSQSNIRTAASPMAITRWAEGAGLKLVKESMVTPNEGMQDGKWEAWAVSDGDFVTEIEEHVKDSREKAVVHALRDTMLKSLTLVGGDAKKVRSMDAWCAVFEKA